MSAKEKYTKRIGRYERSTSCLPCCFSGSPVSESRGSEPTPAASRPGPKHKASRWFSWSRFWKKKKTVPVNAPGDATPPGRRDNDMFQKARSSKSRSKPQEEEHRVNVNTKSQQTRLSQISRQPVPPSWTADPVRTMTRTSHPGSPELNQPASAQNSDRAGRLHPVVGLSVLVATLAVLLLCGRACAVVCLCACFYLLPLLSAVAADSGGGEKKIAEIKVDMDSEEYKKRVVLEGLLKRNDRRVSGSIIVGAAPTPSI